MMMGEAVGLALADDLEAEAEKRADVVFEAARDIAAEYDTEIETEVGLGYPVRAILEYAEDYDAIVMGSHGRHSEDITRGYLIGNVAKEAFRRSPIPVRPVIQDGKDRNRTEVTKESEAPTDGPPRVNRRGRAVRSIHR